MRSLLFLAPLLILFLIAACGGSDDGSDGDDATPAAGDPTPTAADDGDDNGNSDDPTPDNGDQPAEGIAGLSEGDCFDATLTSEETIDYASVTAVDCDEPHRGEVMRVAVPDTDGAYPGELRLRQVSRDVCDPAVFDEYLGADPPSGLSREFPFPSEQAWNDGVRNIICLMYLKYAQLQGSLRGVGQDVFPADFPADAPRPEAIALILAGDSDDYGSVFTGPSLRTLLEDSGIAVEGLFAVVFSLVEPDTLDEARSAIEDAIAPNGWTVESSDPDAVAFVLEKDGRRLVIFSDGGLTITYFYYPE